MWILTVRPSHNILQKSILRGHKSPPTPRHPASSLSFLQVNTPQSAGCLHSLSGSETLHGFLDRGWLSGLVWSALLISYLLSPVRCVGASLRTSHHPGEENNARAQGGPWLSSSTAITNRTWSSICWTKLCVHWQMCVFLLSTNSSSTSKNCHILRHFGKTWKTLWPRNFLLLYTLHLQGSCFILLLRVPNLSLL